MAPTSSNQLSLNSNANLIERSQSRQIKRTPKILLINWLFKKRIRVVPAPVVKFKPWSREYFTRPSLICIWSNWKSLNGLNLLDDIYTTIQGNWAGRNFVTASRVNSWLITYARTWQRWIWSWNLQLPKDDINFRLLINSLMVSIRNPSAYGFGNAHVSSGKLCAGVAKIWLFGPHSVCSLIQPKLFASFKSTSSRKSCALSVLELIKFS